MHLIIKIEIDTIVMVAIVIIKQLGPVIYFVLFIKK